MSVQMSEKEAQSVADMLDEKLSIQSSVKHSKSWKIVERSPGMDELEASMIEFFSSDDNRIEDINELTDILMLSPFCSEIFEIEGLGFSATRLEKIDFINMILDHPIYKTRSLMVPMSCQNFITDENIVDGHLGAFLQFLPIIMDKHKDLKPGMKLMIQSIDHQGLMTNEVCQITEENNQKADAPDTTLFDKFLDLEQNPDHLERHLDNMLMKFATMTNLVEKYSLDSKNSLVEKIGDHRILCEMFALVTNHCQMEYQPPSLVGILTKEASMRHLRALKLVLLAINIKNGRYFDLNITEQMLSDENTRHRIMFFLFNTIKYIINERQDMLSDSFKRQLKFDAHNNIFELPFDIELQIDGDMRYQTDSMSRGSHRNSRYSHDDDDVSSTNSVSSSNSMSSLKSNRSVSSTFSRRSTKEASHRSHSEKSRRSMNESSRMSKRTSKRSSRSSMQSASFDH